MPQELKKRIWHYIQKPTNYEILCDRCKGRNIEWSEFEGHIWCYDCEVDTKGTQGIFDGIISIGVCKALGISLDIYDMEKKKIVPFDEWGKDERYT